MRQIFIVLFFKKIQLLNTFWGQGSWEWEEVQFDMTLLCSVPLSGMKRCQVTDGCASCGLPTSTRLVRSHIWVSSSLRMPCHFSFCSYHSFCQNEWGQIYLRVSVCVLPAAAWYSEACRNAETFLTGEATIWDWEGGIGMPYALVIRSGGPNLWEPRERMHFMESLMLALAICGRKKGGHHSRHQMHFASQCYV